MIEEGEGREEKNFDLAKYAAGSMAGGTVGRVLDNKGCDGSVGKRVLHPKPQGR